MEYLPYPSTEYVYVAFLATPKLFLTVCVYVTELQGILLFCVCIIAIAPLLI